MSLPIVAIIGRPNVGKSSLFNLIAKKQISVVHDYPGVTRDRIYADIEWDDCCFTIADTGGLDAKPEEELIDQVQHQVETAVEEAKVIVFLVDVRTGVMPHDLLVAEKLRQADKPIFLVVNKVEGKKFDNDIYDFYRLGLVNQFRFRVPRTGELGIYLSKLYLPFLNRMLRTWVCHRQ